MKIVPCTQGEAGWHMARKGIPTASNFDKIITPVTGKLSKSATKYAYRLCAERLLNCPLETMEGSEWMDRGQELEPTAVWHYEEVNGVKTVKVGFITTDDGLLGCSPDRLVEGQPIGVEIKCPSPQVHLGYLIDGHPIEYRPQVQGQMLVGEFEHVDFQSYHPRMPAKLITTPRDEAYIALMRAALAGFNEMLFEMLERARSLGMFQAYEEALTPSDVERADGLTDEFRQDFGLPPLTEADQRGPAPSDFF